MPRGGKREGAGRASAFPGQEVKPASFKLPAPLLAELAERAAASGETQTAIVARAVRELLDREPPP